MKDVLVRTKRILSEPGFAGILASAFALGLGSSFVSPFLSLWGTEEIGMRPLMFGAYMTTTSLSALIVATTLARWSDTHLPRKTVLMLGSACGALGYSGYALLHNPFALICVGSTVLAVAAVCFSQLFAHTRERFFATNIPGVPQGFLLSVVRVCFSLAWTAGPSVGAWVQVTYGFRGLFFGAATLFLVFFFGVLRFVPHENHPPHRRDAVHESVWRVISRGDIAALFVAFLLIFAAHTINLMNLPIVITRLLGGDGHDVGIAFGIGPLAEIPLMLWFGILAARGHQLALIRFGAAATVIYFLLLTLTREPWHVFPLQIFHGLSFAIISNVAILFFQDLVPGQVGLATTVFTNSANVGNLVGYFTFGSLLAPIGSRGLFLVSATLTFVTMVIVMRYRPRLIASRPGTPLVESSI
jgi:SET family sugar efflux transporter-like MFS transporter